MANFDFWGNPGTESVAGDIDLAHLHWSNYDLVVIDESHNFRNKKSPEEGSAHPLRPPP